MAQEDIFAADASPAAPPGVGQQLRAARERKGWTLDQIAADTRISQHYLEKIERGEFETLGGRTYAVGFARSYARAVGLNQADVAAMVRAEMDLEPATASHGIHTGGNFEPGDPSRAPSGKLVWFSLAAIVLLGIGLFFASRVLFAPAAELPSLTEQEQAEQAVAAPQEAAPVDAGGEVVFTALAGEPWVRFYDDNGTLYEGNMTEGQTFAIPADAQNPQINTARPHQFTITIGGREVAPLADEMQVMGDVPISAEALLARSQPTGSPTAASTPAARPNAARTATPAVTTQAEPDAQ